jgi:hypothetical protein
MALGLDNFHKWHEATSLAFPVAREAAAPIERAPEARSRRKCKNMQKQGVFVLFLLYIDTRVPYDENDSRTESALEPFKYGLGTHT